MEKMLFRETPERKIHPDMLDRMEKIVRTVIRRPKYRADFQCDLDAMPELNHFAWFVYDCGTNLVPLVKDEIDRFQNEWLATIDDFKIRKQGDPYRLYFCNTQRGSIARIHEFNDGNLFQRLQGLL